MQILHDFLTPNCYLTDRKWYNAILNTPTLSKPFFFQARSKYFNALETRDQTSNQIPVTANSTLPLLYNSFSITHPSWRIVWICTKCQTNDHYPAILWCFRYPKQERTKFFSQDFFCNRDFKIPHFSLLFLLHSDITA